MILPSATKKKSFDNVDSSNHPNNADTSILAEQLLRERDRADELSNRFAKIKEEFAEAGQREAELRSHLGKKEKEVALVKHELKEAQRKAEQEQGPMSSNLF